MKNHLLIVGFWSVIAGKYMRFIQEYFDEGLIDWYSIVDIESQSEYLTGKVDRLGIKPTHAFYITDDTTWKDINHISEFDDIIKKLTEYKDGLKVYISTDPRFHEWYLAYCIDNEIDCVVEKPIFTPTSEWKFDPSLYESKFLNLLDKAKKKKGNFSVMSGARYHEIFNHDILDNIEQKMVKYKIPITSFHIRVGSGVRNLGSEFSSREDHPYKYWFGLLNHGAYHYLDVLAQCLKLNKELLHDTFTLTLNSMVAHASDQSARIPLEIYDSFDWKPNDVSYNTDDLTTYGETDIVTTLSLKNSQGKVVMLGTLAFEHTTPCCRNRSKLNFEEYNKNGRLPCIDVEIQLSTLYSVHAHMIKKPEDYTKYSANVLFRSNKLLMNDEKYYEYKSYPDFEGKWKYHLIRNRLLGEEKKSALVNHDLTMKLLDKMSISSLQPWESVSFEI